MRTRTCSACGSKHLARLRPMAQGFGGPTVLYAYGGGALGFGRRVSELRAMACVDCGAVQFLAADMEALAREYERQQQQHALRLEE